MVDVSAARVAAPSARKRFRWGRVRRRVYRLLEPTAWVHRGLSPLNKLVFALIVVAVGLAILETEPTVSHGHQRLFGAFETVFGVIFSLEYAARTWIAVENPSHGRGWRGRLRYVLTPAAMVDLIAIVASFATPTGLSPFIARLFRLARILRLAKLGRMSRAMNYLIDAIKARRYELFFSLCVGMSFVVVAATLLYIIEGPIQPDKFGSIPRAMWWSTVTLTTIGYGDAYPVTTLGKIVAGAAALASIGLVAMPTGIMAAAFSEAIQRHARETDDKDQD